MKKMVILATSLALALSSAPAVSETTLPFGRYTAGSEIQSGWYSLATKDGLELSTFFLPDGCVVNVPSTVTLSKDDAVRPFTAAPGIYFAPSNIPPGTYSVRCDESSKWCTVTVYDSNNKLALSQVMHSDEGGFVGSVPILDGYTVKVEQGSARFDAPAGIVFD